MLQNQFDDIGKFGEAVSHEARQNGHSYSTIVHVTVVPESKRAQAGENSASWQYRSAQGKRFEVVGIGYEDKDEFPTGSLLRNAVAYLAPRLTSDLKIENSLEEIVGSEIALKIVKNPE